MGNHKIVVDGATKDLQDDYNVTVETSAGMGVPFVNNLNTEKAQQPGATLEGQTYQARTMTWNCHITGTTQADFHDNRQAFIKALDPNTGKINAQMTGIEVQYTGATVDKKINVVYDGGLEGNNWNQAFQESFALRLRADDPLWKSTAADTTTALDSEDSATFSHVAKREGDASVPIYSTMGAPATAAPASSSPLSIKIDDTYAYYGGVFTNWDGIANADNIARWHKTNEVWSALGTGANGRIRAMAINSDGDLYVGGDFTTIGGGAYARIAKWDGSTWAAVGSGTGANASVYALAFDDSGNLYIGGSFSTVDGVAAAEIAKWDGSTWAALGTSPNNAVFSLVFTGGFLYVGGQFTTAGGATANRIAKWDGSAWSNVGTTTGFDSRVNSLAVTTGGFIYAGGNFTTIDGTSANYVAMWNKSSWEPLGVGVGDQVNWLTYTDDNILYAAGDFTTAGNVTAQRSAFWNGSGWTRLDFEAGWSSGSVYVALDNSDGALYLGFTNTGTATFSGDLTVAYAGTAVSYPQITINRSGGTSAKLIQLKNETTGATLYFDYDLLDGETLTIEFDQTSTTAGMSSSIRGNVYSELLPNSNFGTFYLTPGNASTSNNNVITLFIDVAGAPTMTSNIIYTNTYISAD